jgi:hypothetical protein
MLEYKDEVDLEARTKEIAAKYEIKKRIAELSATKQTLVDDYDADRIDAANYESRMDAVDNELAILHEQEQALEAQRSSDNENEDDENMAQLLDEEEDTGDAGEVSKSMDVEMGETSLGTSTVETRKRSRSETKVSPYHTMGTHIPLIHVVV